MLSEHCSLQSERREDGGRLLSKQKTVENSRDLTAGGEGGGRLMMRGENLGYRRAPKTLLDTEFKTTSIAPFPTRKHKCLIYSNVAKHINSRC